MRFRIVFFFQAEDGIRDIGVTGVQTCALPIWMMAAIDLARPDGRPFDPKLRTGRRVYRQAVIRGALLRPLGDTMYLFPPLDTPAEDLRAMVAILGESIDAVPE